MTEAELMYGTVSKATAIALTAGVVLLAGYMIWCWYKAKLAEEAARVERAKWHARQTDIAFKHLREDKSARYEAQIKALREENDALRWKNNALQTRLDTITKAKGVAHDQAQI